MSKILITGNGFDLFHHLPTKYGHFMAVMKTIENLNKNDEFTFEDLFGGYFKNEYKKGYENLKGIIGDNQLLFSKERIQQIGILYDNVWYQYFNKVSQIQTWIDFENEISFSLKIASKIISSYDGSVQNFLKKDTHKGYLILVYLKIIKEIDGSKFQIEDKYINDISGKVNSNELFEYLIKQLKVFTKVFNMYLNDFVVRIMDFVEKKEIDFDNIDTVFTFNYTPTLERIYAFKGAINYVHGKVSNYNEDINLVLGVDELENEVKQAKAFFFLKNNQKILTGNNIPFIEEISPNRSSYDEPIVYYFIGHSLDKSDKNYISKIFNSLGNDESKKCQIVIFYIDRDDFSSKLNNLFSYIDNDKLMCYFEEERLKFVQLNDKELNAEFQKEIIGNEFKA